MTTFAPLAGVFFDLTDIRWLVIWSLVLIGLIVAGLAVVLQIKKRLTHVEPSSQSPGGFTLSDLRQMVKAGTLTPQEFEKAKLKIVEAARKAAERSDNSGPKTGAGGGNI